MNNQLLFWVLISIGLHVSTFKHKGAGITSLSDGTTNSPLLVDINYNYMLTNQPIQMSQTFPPTGMVQTPAIPQRVSSNGVTVLDESLMIQYTSSPPIVTASMTPGIVDPIDDVTANSAQVDLVPVVESDSSNEAMSTVRVDNATSTIGSVTTPTTSRANSQMPIVTTTPSSILATIDSINSNEPQTTTLISSSSSANSVTSTLTSSINSDGQNDTTADAPETTTPVVTSTLGSVTPTAFNKDAESRTSINQIISSLNTSVTGPIVGFVLPAEIKIFVNINSMPPISINVANVAPTTSETTIDVDIFEGNNTAVIRNDYVESTRETVAGTTSNIDLSNQITDYGQSSTMLPLLPVTTVTPMTTTTTTTAPITRTPFLNRIHENKCNQYYDIGTRKVRKVQVHLHIIGGTYSSQKEFPHMAALGYGNKVRVQWLCGGSLISEEYVITAAHCLSAKHLGDIQFVRLGTTTLQTETLESEDYNVAARFPHPDYIVGKQYNDIALLKLDHRVNFSDYIAPICLAGANDLTYTKLVATGWGKDASGRLSPELLKVELDYVSRDVCQRGYDGISSEELPDGIREDSQLCAGSAQGSKDTCQGDSGGPLQMQQDGRMYLIGITSFGIGCGRPESPGVYTRVSYYIPWIESIVWV